MKTLSNTELTEKFEEVLSNIIIYRGRVDKYLKENKRLKKELNRALNSDEGIDADVLRRIQLAEGEIDACANTINYFMSKAGNDEDEKEDKDDDKKDATEVAGYDFTDTLIPEKIKT